MRSWGWGSELAAIVLTVLIGGETLAQGAGSTTFLRQPTVFPPPRSQADPETIPEGSTVLTPAEGAPEGDSAGWLSGLSFEGDYLFLRPHRQPMDFAIVNPTGGNVPDGTIVNRDWAWRSAFRTGLGYRLPGQEWGAGFYYTYLHSAASGSVAAPDGGNLFATLTHPGTVEQVQTASADTSLNYNVYDLEVGRWWHPGDAFALRAFGGGRFARIDQNFTAFYDGGDANKDQVTQRLHFNGGGLRTGAEATWVLGGGLSLFGRANASLVGGDFHATLVETNNAGTTTLTNVSDHSRNVVPVTELTMGAGWQYRNVRITAGYTFINWFGLVNVPDFADDAHQGKITYRTGDLSLQGLVLRAAWWF